MFSKKQILAMIFVFNLNMGSCVLQADDIPNSLVTEIISENFDVEILQSDLPVILDVYAVWCGPCNQMKSIVEELAQKFDGKVKFAKINVDEQRNLVNEFEVRFLPTFIFFNNGNNIEKINGARSLDAFEELLNKYLEDLMLSVQLEKNLLD